jgi:hypothetical protein
VTSGAGTYHPKSSSTIVTGGAGFTIFHLLHDCPIRATLLGLEHVGLA